MSDAKEVNLTYSNFDLKNNMNKQKINMFELCIICIFGLVIVTPFAPILLWDHLLTITLSKEKSDPSDTRFSLIMGAISLILTAPLFVHILC